MHYKPLIFLTNDDGIFAPGLRSLIKIARQLGEVVVVAPDKPQSGMGHAVTTSSPLRIRKLHEEDNYAEYSCNGTPADTVKVGENVVLKRKPDLLLSGINHGSNSGINILYSGTMAAALEGAMSNVPSIGFSLLDYSLEADFEASSEFVKKIVELTLKNGMAPHTCLNVNIPAVSAAELKGIKICRMGRGFWDEELQERTDPHSRKYYWLAGKFVSLDEGIDTDQWALSNNYISVVPIHLDMTAYSAIDSLKNLENHDE